MKSQALCSVVLAGVLLAAASGFSQGLYTESTLSGGPLGDRTIASKTYYMPKMMKAVADEEGTAMIFRIDRQMIYEVNPGQKTYSETSFAEWETRMKGVDAKMNEMQKQMENLPEEQRKMMEQMMGGRMPGRANADAKVDVVKSGDRKPVGGFSCTKYAVTEDGKEVLTLWATRDVKGFDAMKKDYEEFSRRMTPARAQGARRLADALKKVDGFPMEIEFAEGMKTVVTKAVSRSIPVSEFEVPAGYTKVKSKMAETEEQGGE